MAGSAPKPVRVFISYSHDSTEHEDRVLALSNRLVKEGVDSVIDRYGEPEDGWPIWMEEQIREADFVLVVCTAEYRRRIEKKDEPTKGRGVVWEINIIYNWLYDAKLSKKCIPVLFEGSSADDIPLPLKGYDRYHVSSEGGYESLYRRLTSQRYVEKPPLGTVRILPRRAGSEEPLPGVASLERLSKTMSNPKYVDDIYRLDRTWQRSSVVNRETIIIVVGTNIIAELLDRSAAEILRDEIDRQGSPYPFQRGVIVTHDGWYGEQQFIKDNAVIAIGGPKVNKLTEEFDKIPVGPGAGDPKNYSIPGPGDRRGFFRKNSSGLPQVALWAKTANDTRETVEHYIKNSAGLKDFLKMCWKG